ncbi:hypothetical protein SDC9_179000 [bioreactor metagenome]|uniref:Uncharacterized protein n=1 Tax=bioreactor metagenome TaxID=1076179 RepID=A0A645GZ57_9ZZZZ
MVPGVYLIPYDKAVKIRPFRHHTNHGGHEHVHEGKIRHIRPMFTNKILHRLQRHVFLEEILGIHAGTHDEGNYIIYGIHITHTPAIISIEQAALIILLHKYLQAFQPSLLF